MREVPWPDGLPPFADARAGEPASDDDATCERIRADARRLVTLGRAGTLARYLEAIPDLADRPAALDAAIVAVIESGTAAGAARDEVIEAMLAEHPALRDAVLAADFLDQTLGGGIGNGDEPNAAPAIELPCEIGPAMPGGRKRYELRTRIAEGASGVVYRAIDRAVSTPERAMPVAVKCLHSLGFRLPHLFKLEAQRARRVEHPSVARVLDAGEDPRAGEYLVFEYCEGQTLEQWAARRISRSTAGEAVALLLGIADGIAAVHRAGFCHGDLHPGNAIVARDGSPRLIDFGAARSDVTSLSVSARPLGALGFAAPELFRAGAPISGQAADTYALAALLYWLLIGEPPNGATVEEAEATIGGERTLDPARLKSQPRDIAVIIARALDRDPARRYPSVEALAEDLRRWQRHEPVAWTPGPLAHRAALAVRRAPVASALTAGLAMALAISVVSLVAAFYVSSRSQLAETRTQMAATESKLSAMAAQARAAEAINQEMEVAKGLWSVMRSMLASIKSDSDAMRYLPILMVVERIAGEELTSDPLLLAESRGKRIEIAEHAIQPVLARGSIDRLQDMLIAMVLGGIWIEDGNPAGAREVLALARTAARKHLSAEDPLAVRVDVYWAIATRMLAASGNTGLHDGEADEAALILQFRRPVVDSLGPRMLKRLNEAPAPRPPGTTN